MSTFQNLLSKFLPIKVMSGTSAKKFKEALKKVEKYESMKEKGKKLHSSQIRALLAAKLVVEKYRNSRDKEVKNDFIPQSEDEDRCFSAEAQKKYCVYQKQSKQYKLLYKKQSIKKSHMEFKGEKIRIYNIAAILSNLPAERKHQFVCKLRPLLSDVCVMPFRMDKFKIMYHTIEEYEKLCTNSQIDTRYECMKMYNNISNDKSTWKNLEGRFHTFVEACGGLNGLLCKIDASNIKRTSRKLKKHNKMRKKGGKKQIDESKCDAENELPEESLIPSSKFRFQSRRFFLTYKSHIPKEQLHEFIRSVVKCDMLFLRSAHETGDKCNNYDHTHTLVEISKRFQSINPRIFDYKSIHPNIRKINSDKHFFNTRRYLAKEDSENSDLIDELSLIEKIMACSNVHDAMRRYGNTPSSTEAISRLYDKYSKKEYAPVSDFKLCPWQQTFYDEELKVPRHLRKVIWMYDAVGGAGKSSLISHLCDRIDIFGNGFACVTGLGRESDCAEVMMSAIESGWTCEVLLVDLARQKETHQAVYSNLEAILNGRLTALKWKGKTVRLLRRPKIIVCANWLPNMNAWSKDRYDCRMFKGKPLCRDVLTLVKMTGDEIKSCISEAEEERNISECEEVLKKRHAMKIAKMRMHQKYRKLGVSENEIKVIFGFDYIER